MDLAKAHSPKAEVFSQPRYAFAIFSTALSIGNILSSSSTVASRYFALSYFIINATFVEIIGLNGFTRFVFAVDKFNNLVGSNAKRVEIFLSFAFGHVG